MAAELRSSIHGRRIQEERNQEVNQLSQDRMCLRKSQAWRDQEEKEEERDEAVDEFKDAREQRDLDAVVVANEIKRLNVVHDKKLKWERTPM